MLSLARRSKLTRSLSTSLVKPSTKYVVNEMTPEEIEEYEYNEAITRKIAKKVLPDHVSEKYLPYSFEGGLDENPALRFAGRLSDIPEEQLDRVAVIFRQGKRATSSFSYWNLHWKLIYPPLARSFYVEPLMGWTGTTDPYASFEMRFDSPEQAIEYCKKHGIKYIVQDSPTRDYQHGKKSYADNWQASHHRQGILETHLFELNNDYSSTWTNLPHTNFGDQNIYRPDPVTPKKKFRQRK